MQTLKTVIVAASIFAAAAGTSARANEELNSGFHGNMPVTAQKHQVSPRVFGPDAHSALAHVHPVQQSQPAPANPLIDKIHGQPAG